MPPRSLQNRVDPWGRLHAIPQRGHLMGNRGRLHDDARQIVRQWARKPWVTCVLSFQGIKRIPFSAGSYSELFFLDEATALAAGHRPCNTCQRDRYGEFKSTWIRANLADGALGFVPISHIDDVLHAERVDRDGQKCTYDASMGDLPSGAMFAYQTDTFLVWQGRVLRWTFDGYTAAVGVPAEATVCVLTPKSIVRTLANGYHPNVHPTAGA